MKYSDAEAIPPCEFSAHCLRLLDDLDAPGDERAFRQGLVSDTRDMQDEYLIEQLRVHVPGCPVCSTKVAEARSQRLQQRIALRRYLIDAEARVPSTTERILSMAQQMSQEETEQPTPLQKRQRYMLPELFVPLLPPRNNESGSGNGHFSQATDQQPQPAYHTGHWLRNGFALATAAALIFAALGVFNHFVFHNGTPVAHEEVKNWPSVIIGVSLLSSLPAISKFYNVDTASGAREPITVTDQFAQKGQYETVSPDGKDMLYHVSSQGQVMYAIWQLGKSGGIVSSIAASSSNNAIWMDNDHIFIAFTQQGVEEFDIHTGATVKQFASLTNVSLLFYHAPYLYYQDVQRTAIYRSNLATSVIEQLFTRAGGRYFAHCVLNPVGTGIYCEGQTDRLSRTGNDLYLVSSDGSGVQSLSRRGILLGFAPDHALLYLQVMFNNYRVVKLGQTLLQDRVVMNNVAPASVIVEAGDVLLAPDGHGLVVQDGNLADYLRGVWYDDLTTQTSRELFTYPPGSSGQLIGWDQLRVNGTTPDPATPVGQLQFATAA